MVVTDRVDDTVISPGPGAASSVKAMAVSAESSAPAEAPPSVLTRIATEPHLEPPQSTPSQLSIPTNGGTDEAKSTSNDGQTDHKQVLEDSGREPIKMKAESGLAVSDLHHDKSYAGTSNDLTAQYVERENP